MILTERFKVISQVASLLILSDDVDFAVNLEVVDYSKHVFALWTSLLGFDFWDRKMGFFIVVVRSWNSFDDNLDTE